MPPKKQQDVYVVVCSDYTLLEDGPVPHLTANAYTSLQAAKNAIQSSLTALKVKAMGESEDVTRDGHLPEFNFCSADGDCTHEFVVLKTPLLDLESSKPNGKVAATNVSSTPKAKKSTSHATTPKTGSQTLDEDEDELQTLHEVDDDDTIVAGISKNTAISRKQTADGQPKALAGVKLLFTGVLQMDRDTCKKTAKKFGAQVVTKLEDTDYIVIGDKPGPKKLKIIDENELETISEQEFLELLQTGVPVEKRARMAANRAADEAEAPPKKKSKKA